MLRFHLPLIEPDLPFSGIRLSDKTSYRRPQPAMPRRTQLFQAQLLVQILIGKPRVDSRPHSVLVAALARLGPGPKETSINAPNQQ